MATPQRRAARAGLARRAAAAVALAFYAAVATGLTGCAVALTWPAAAAAERLPALSETDRRFVLEAASACQYHSEAGRLGEQRSHDPLVRTYAGMLAQQHAGAFEELRLLLQARGDVAWVGGVPAMRRHALDALAALPAEAFDRRFIEQVGLADQRADLLLFETGSRTLGDPLLRAWALRVLPLLQNQLGLALELPPRAPTSLH